MEEFTKEYKDFHSYYETSEEIVFTRSELKKMKLLRKEAVTKRTDFTGDNFSQDMTLTVAR
jgi:hypothetical protein